MSITLPCLLFLSLVSATEERKTTGYPRAELLIETDVLAKWIARNKNPDKDPELVILDARSRERFVEGRIASKQVAWVDVNDWSKAIGSTPDAKAWAKRLSDLSIKPNTQVVVYDDNVVNAARVWWILRFWGVNHVRLLNGGWPAWRAAGGASERGEPATKGVAAGSAEPTGLATRLATRQQLLADLMNPKRFQIVDARSRAEYCGEANTAKRNGSIPGARHLDWNDLIDGQTRKFKSADELAKLTRAAGLDLEKPTVTYCQSGGRASVMAFALELMGAKEVRNYYGSWADWGNAEETPIEKPKR